MTHAPITPSSSYLGVGATTPTIFGAGPPASIHAALSDVTGSTPIDTTGVHAGTTPSYDDRTFFTVHTFVTPPGGWTFNYVFIRFRAIFLASTHGYFYPHALWGVTPDGARHSRKFPSGPPGPGSLTAHQVDTAISTFAVDGADWGDCESFEIEWKVAYNTDYVGAAWDGTNYPRLVHAWVVLDPLYVPTAYDPLPTGTITVSQPQISWTTGNGPHTSYRVIIVPDGAEDADGVDAGDTGFDPETSDEVSYDTGRVYSTDHFFSLPEPLTNGVYWTYTNAWAGQGERAVRQLEWDGFDTFTVDTDTVDTPVLSLSNDSPSYTVRVQTVPGSGADHVAAAIQVQRWDFDAAVWRNAPVADSLVSGTATSAFYDSSYAPGAPVRYRARGVFITGGGEVIVSPWDTENATAADKQAHWLRSTGDHTLNISINDAEAALVKTWDTRRQRPQTAMYGIGQRAATMSYDITKGTIHELAVWTLGDTAYQALRTLIESGDDLILISQWGEVWRCQVAPDIKEDWYPAAPTGAETTPLGKVRCFHFSLVEVVTP